MSFSAHPRSSWIVLKFYPLLAQRTLQLLFQPKIDALWMEFVRTGKSLYHLSGLKIVQTDCARVFFCFFRACSFTFGWFLGFCSLFFLFEFEAGYGVDDVFYFFCWPQRLTIFIKLLILLCILTAVNILALVLLLLEMPLHTSWYILSIWACWHSVEEELLVATRVARGVLEILLSRTSLSLELLSIKVHLYAWIVLKMVQHVLNVAHDPWEVEELIWIIGTAILLIWVIASILLLLLSLLGCVCSCCCLSLSTAHALGHSLPRTVWHVWHISGILHSWDAI